MVVPERFPHSVPSWPGLSRPPTPRRAAPRPGRPRTAPARSENPRQHGSAWVPGTSPGMTLEGAEKTGRGRAWWFRIGSRTPSRHGRACPGHPRRAEPLPAPDGPGPVRTPAAARVGVGARDKPGHDPGGGGEDRSREGMVVPERFPPSLPSWPGLSRPPTPRRATASPGRPRTAPARSENPRRHGPAWVPGTSPGMTLEGAENTGRGRAWRFRSGSRTPSRHGRACPGHPRRAEPLLAPDGPGPVRRPAAARVGVGTRDKPGHDSGGGGGRPDSVFRIL